ncbi:LysR family transcriptional regulator [Pygmaiobacter massiliensis]|uniref:LysR family transcriptional regulator n=1 Tax=Pygmaiobacter massiliensis TaxID=1917873 RepID=UPI002A8085FA|nr:LysR family transcriptional regulator [Pygmaiobacter massiliensis]MDY4784744.1 LysR family transcriptional regulator [Pygmaiobacter massiliensis]
MNFLNLKYFVLAAEELNFTRAAKRLYVSQQSLSNHITKLEEHFGTKLFDRTPPMTLTPAGQSFYKNALSLLDLEKQTEQELEDIKNFCSGDLTIGVPSARGAVMLPLLLPAFHALFPQVRIHLLDGTSSEIDEALRRGEVDLTIGFNPRDPQICSEMLREERMVVAVPNETLKEFFPGRRRELLVPGKPVSLSLFSDCPFIALRRSTWAGRIFFNCCEHEELTPRIVVETGQVETLVSLGLSGLGAIVCPQLFLDATHRDLSGVTIFPLDYEEACQAITVNYLKNKYQTKAAKEFILLSKELLRR